MDTQINSRLARIAYKIEGLLIALLVLWGYSNVLVGLPALALFGYLWGFESTLTFIGWGLSMLLALVMAFID